MGIIVTLRTIGIVTLGAESSSVYRLDMQSKGQLPQFDLKIFDTKRMLQNRLFFHYNSPGSYRFAIRLHCLSMVIYVGVKYINLSRPYYLLRESKTHSYMFCRASALARFIATRLSYS